MPAYRALIEGRNFLLNLKGSACRHGFYQTVFVHSADPKEAESQAIRVVKEDSELKQLVLNEPGDPPMLYLDSLEELSGIDSARPVKGRSYYVEKHWWQFWR